MHRRALWCTAVERKTSKHQMKYWPYTAAPRLSKYEEQRCILAIMNSSFIFICLTEWNLEIMNVKGDYPLRRCEVKKQKNPSLSQTDVTGLLTRWRLPALIWVFYKWSTIPEPITFKLLIPSDPTPNSEPPTSVGGTVVLSLVCGATGESLMCECCQCLIPPLSAPLPVHDTNWE